MSEWLAHIDFAGPGPRYCWRCRCSLVFSRYRQNHRRARAGTVLPSLIDALQLDTRPKRGSGASAVLFWLIWSLLVCAGAAGIPDAATIYCQTDARHRADPRCLRVNGEK